MKLPSKEAVKRASTEIFTVEEGKTQANIEITDPAKKLIAIVGATLLNEPTYYTPATGRVTTEYNPDAFNEQARLVINTAMEVAKSSSPKDLLSIAHWARRELGLRGTPQVLLAVAAHCQETKQYIKKYTPKIIQRADEIKQTFTAYRSLFGSKKSLPNSLKRGLSEAFKKFGEADFLKYEGKNRPTFADVLKMVDRKLGYPLSKPIDTWLRTGTVVDQTATPIAWAREQLAKCKEFNSNAKELAKNSKATWEVLLSQFGNTAGVWEFLVSEDLIGYQALLQNLRNILGAGVSEGTINKVCAKLIFKAEFSHQAPHKFIIAAKVVEELKCHGSSLVLGALSMALEAVAKQLTRLPGKSLIAVDTSGSMSHRLSNRGETSMEEVAAVLGAIAYKISDNGSVIGAFADKFERITCSNEIGPLELFAKVANTNAGGGTNETTVMEYAFKSNTKFDRLILISDMQTYGVSTYDRWGDENENKKSATLKDMVVLYRKDVNSDFYLHSIDLAGHGYDIADQNDIKSNLVAGFSEKLLDTIARFEGRGNQEEVRQETTLDYIRGKY